MRLLVPRPAEDPLFRGLPPESLVYVPFSRTWRDPAAAERCRTLAPAPDVLLLTSANAARALGDVHGLTPGRVAAVGPATAEAARAIGLNPEDLKANTGQALVKALGPLRGKTVLWARGADAHPGTGEALREAKAELIEVVVYTQQPVTDLASRLIEALPVDAAILLSSQNARQFNECLGGSAPPVVSIGPTTTATCHELGLRVLVQAGRPDSASLAAAVRHALR